MNGGVFLFVGERRSPTAIRRGWTWRDGRLCAGTLFAALRAAGFEPADQEFVNVRQDNGATDWAAVRQAQASGRPVVALGDVAHTLLERAHIPHRVLVHPAARGAIRLRERYHAHVAALLGGGS